MGRGRSAHCCHSPALWGCRPPTGPSAHLSFFAAGSGPGSPGASLSRARPSPGRFRPAAACGLRWLGRAAFAPAHRAVLAPCLHRASTAQGGGLAWPLRGCRRMRWMAGAVSTAHRGTRARAPVHTWCLGLEGGVLGLQLGTRGLLGLGSLGQRIRSLDIPRSRCLARAVAGPDALAGPGWSVTGGAAILVAGQPAAGLAARCAAGLPHAASAQGSPQGGAWRSSLCQPAKAGLAVLQHWLERGAMLQGGWRSRAGLLPEARRGLCMQHAASDAPGCGTHRTGPQPARAAVQRTFEQVACRQRTLLAACASTALVVAALSCVCMLERLCAELPAHAGARHMLSAHMLESLCAVTWAHSAHQHIRQDAGCKLAARVSQGGRPTCGGQRPIWAACRLHRCGVCGQDGHKACHGALAEALHADHVAPRHLQAELGALAAEPDVLQGGQGWTSARPPALEPCGLPAGGRRGQRCLSSMHAPHTRRQTSPAPSASASWSRW